MKPASTIPAEGGWIGEPKYLYTYFGRLYPKGITLNKCPSGNHRNTVNLSET